MHGQPARPKATHEGQTRTHRDDKDVNARVALPIHGDLAVLGGAHERVKKFARARGGLFLVATQQTATTRSLGRGAHAHRTHVRGKGYLREQEDHEDDKSLNEDRRDNLGTAFRVPVRCPQSSPSHG